MQQVRLKSLAKVNLDLRVLHKRPDGYHELRTVFQTISLADTLEIEFEKARRTELTIDDPLAIPDNLVLRAARVVLEAMRMHARVHFRLTKRIPMGGGLGGGSSNAASVLLALPVLSNRAGGGRAIPFERLQELALGLGSDVPFFLLGGTALGLGRGEELYPLPDLSPEPLLVVSSGLHVSTAEAYRSLNRGSAEGDHASPSSLTFTGSSRSIVTFQAFVGALAMGRSAKAASPLGANDFEAAVFRQYPQLKTLAAKLRKLGAAGVRMTGSGSAVFAIFGDRESRERAETALRQDALGRRGDGPEDSRVIRVELVNRRQYRKLWLRQLGLGPYPEGFRTDNEKIWPPQNQYAR
jgi:4-diphosphocytidyl-2-C-methyl-D-erythritol kinase